MDQQMEGRQEIYDRKPLHRPRSWRRTGSLREREMRIKSREEKRVVERESRLEIMAFAKIAPTLALIACKNPFKSHLVPKTSCCCFSLGAPDLITSMAFEVLFYQARRHYFIKTTPYQASLFLRSHYSSHPPFLLFHRLLSSSTSAESNPEPTPETQPPRKPQPTPIQPVSYPTKSKDPSGSQSQPHPSQSSPPPPPQKPRISETHFEKPILSEVRTWTREDIRFVKDVPQISPVSYPTRVAPLPEDRAEVKEEGEDRKGENEELEKERKRIEADNRVIRRVLRVEEEKVPFPTLIKVENKRNEKVIYDLKEGIKLVKVRVLFLHFGLNWDLNFD
ncbi:unnamed protein product [Ilex paraguariensis]|uniref:Uncharacterized protein n=1 Tax=Ilex paraguariensis TaxID=185542 RepID=A0ABC8TG13_9AQUA